ncbi:MAG: depupylase/deamidase Dop [Acidimicrobiales bacterium]
MAISKVCGVETEYGIAVTGMGDANSIAANPIAASSVLINAYVAYLSAVRQAPSNGVGWDFATETPGRDARGFAREGAKAPEVETHLVNAVMTNGARYYVDHAHPEYSTPECTNALDVVRYDKAGERVLIESMAAAAEMLPKGQRIVIYKNNSDRKGNSYGCHENYLMERSVPFNRVIAQVIPHFVTRQIYTGAGKVGAEVSGGSEVEYQLSQRADFFEEEVGLETTLKRPIVNTRDEPHADPSRYRRLHVIVGDANLAEVATYLKVGVTSIVLAMIEDDWLGERDLSLAAPVRAMCQVSYDLSLTQPLRLAAGGTMTALELQWELWDLARKYSEDRGLACLGEGDAGRAVLERWEQVLNGLETDPESLAQQLDWVAKRRLLAGYAERHGLSWRDPRMAAIDLQYHDLRPERSLFARLDTERLVTEDSVIRAVTEPPHDTRAYFRGKCLQRWGSAVAAANWDSLVFDLGTNPLRRIPMMEPLRGTASHVDKLLEGCASPAELVERLGS